jgi:hypothetical protein
MKAKKILKAFEIYKNAFEKIAKSKKYKKYVNEINELIEYFNKILVLYKIHITNATMADLDGDDRSNFEIKNAYKDANLIPNEYKIYKAVKMFPFENENKINLYFPNPVFFPEIKDNPVIELFVLKFPSDFDDINFPEFEQKFWDWLKELRKRIKDVKKRSDFYVYFELLYIYCFKTREVEILAGRWLKVYEGEQEPISIKE